MNGLSDPRRSQEQEWWFKDLEQIKADVMLNHKEVGDWANHHTIKLITGKYGYRLNMFVQSEKLL